MDVGKPKISYDCSDLIEEIEADIEEFGADFPAFAIWEKRLVRVPFTTDSKCEVNLLVDYELGEDKPDKLFDGEIALLSTLGAIHDILVEQNKPI